MALPRWLLVAGFLTAFWLGTVTTTPSVSPADQGQVFISDPSPNIGGSASGYGSLPTGDKDCRDFSSHAQAQAFFEAQGSSDPHHLDGDGDGVACDLLR